MTVSIRHVRLHLKVKRATSAEQTRRHIALRLLPFLFILYITNYLDRTSVAYAAIGMARDLGFNDRVFGLDRHFLCQLRGVADTGRAAGSTVERRAAQFAPP